MPFLLIFCIILASTQQTLAGPHHRRVTRGVCGERLAEALSLACDSNYATPSKRSGGFLHRLTDKLRNKYDINALDWSPDQATGEEYPHVDDADLPDIKGAYSLLESQDKRSNDVYFSRNVRGVVEECCHRSCTMSQMRQYCGAGKRSGGHISSFGGELDHSN